MDGKSLNLTEEKLNKLKEIIPEAFTEDRIDWEKLKAALGDEIEFKNERYVLNWAGKADAFRVLQTPTTATLAPCKEESVNFDRTENIFIEGENLEVLKILQKAYFGKVKMIYIDPPYNTGNDSFIYPDKFSESREEYLSRIGDKDEEGLMTREGLFRKNSKDSGHYHSNWLSMMYPRLFLARNLLREDGVIFVSIDDNEVHNLRLLMNEVFGEENFVAEFVWQSKKGGGSDKSGIVTDHEYVLCYSKTDNDSGLARVELNPDELNLRDEKGGYRRGRELNKWGSNSRREDRPTMFFPINGPNGGDVYPIKNDGTEGCWRWGKRKMHEIVARGDVEFEPRRDGTFIVYEKIRDAGPRTKPYRSWLDKTKSTADGSKKVKELFNGKKVFDFAKPVELMQSLLEIGTTSNEDIVMDFFSGAATTAHAVMETNFGDFTHLKFLCVQLPELCDEKKEAFKAGYKTIADIAKERIRQAIRQLEKGNKEILDLQETEDKPDLGFKVFKLQESNFKMWRTRIESEEALVTQMEAHLDPLDENARPVDVAYELLLKSGIPLTAKFEEKKGFILANDGEIALLLENADEKIIKDVISEKPAKVLTLDRLFKGNDQLKTNTALQMKDAGIDFKAV